MPESNPAVGVAPRGTSRRRLLAGAGALALAGAAGCLGFGSDDEGPDRPPDRVPASADLLATLDPTLFGVENGSDGEADGSGDATGGTGSGDDSGSGDDAAGPSQDDEGARTASLADLRTLLEPAHLAGLDADAQLSLVEAAFGGDADAVSELVWFGSFPDAESQAVEAVTAVVDADRSPETAVDSLEAATDVEYAAEGDDQKRYEPTGEATVGLEGTAATVEAPTLGVVAEGRYAVGDAGVTGALEVAAGEEAPVEGPVRRAYEHAAGAPILVAHEATGPLIPEEYRDVAGGMLSFEPVDAVEAIGRSFTATDDGVSAHLHLHAPSEDDAQELIDVIDTAIAVVAGGNILGDDLDDLDEEFQEVLKAVSVDREGDVVELSLSGPVDEAVAVLAEF